MIAGSAVAVQSAVWTNDRFSLALPDHERIAAAGACLGHPFARNGVTMRMSQPRSDDELTTKRYTCQSMVSTTKLRNKDVTPMEKRIRSDIGPPVRLLTLWTRGGC